MKTDGTKNRKQFLLIILLQTFFLKIKMLAGHYQTNKEGLQKKRLVKGIMIFLKNRTIKNLNMLVKNIEVYMKKRKKIQKFLFHGK